ncbi:hypothetical protein C9374_001068 [Naegleria lovaniensis]|uniref:Zn(2)-C6 fungal-type domain-containing protein n=1 Tax=Naegleria lovaniensis TaxID=51637 RepID=A0AA88GXJ8_NAELO|nr:uncharacterized protein C9374_001068 [Naegleria lovaniensis]KAG2388218.1 hypothetical protein C9374_001068 [Naegleria lovaniensis]
MSFLSSSSEDKKISSSSPPILLPLASSSFEQPQQRAASSVSSLNRLPLPLPSKPSHDDETSQKQLTRSSTDSNDVSSTTTTTTNHHHTSGTTRSIMNNSKETSWNSNHPPIVPLAGFKPGFIAQNTLTRTTGNHNHNNNTNNNTTTSSYPASNHESGHSPSNLNHLDHHHHIQQHQRGSIPIMTSNLVNHPQAHSMAVSEGEATILPPIMMRSGATAASQYSNHGVHLQQKQQNLATTIEVNHGNDFNGAVASMSLSVDPSQPRMSCTHCRKSHRKCDKLHPCGECKRRGLQHECVFSEPKKRGPKLRTESDETLISVSPSPTLKQTPSQRKINEPKKRKLPNDNSQNETNSPTREVLKPPTTNYPQVDVSPLSTFEDALLGRKEIDRRNYLLQMINVSLSHNFDTSSSASSMYQIEPSLDYSMQLFFREDFINFIVDCLDNNHREMLKMFVKEKLLLWIQQRVMSDTFYQSIYSAFEALFLKYHCLFKLSIYDDNRSILLSESEKSIKQCKKELFKFLDSTQMGNIEKASCFMWAAFINQVLDGSNEMSVTLSRCALDKLQNDIAIQTTQSHQLSNSPNSEFLNMISKQYLLFCKHSLCADIQQELQKLLIPIDQVQPIMTNDVNSIYFKRLVLKALQLTVIFRYTSSYPYLFLGEFERLVKNNDAFSQLTITPVSTTLDTNMMTACKTIRQTLMDMDCLIPRSSMECWSFLSQLNQQIISTNSPDILFWQFFIQYLKTRMILTGFSPQSKQDFSEQLNHNLVFHLKAIMETCFVVSPLYISITLICVRDLILNLSSSLPSSLKEDYKKFMTHLTSSTREGSHMRSCGNLFINPQKEDIAELLNMVERHLKYSN